MSHEHKKSSGSSSSSSSLSSKKNARHSNYGRAILWVGCDSKEKYFISQEAREFVSSLPSPVCLVSIIGRYRTGKSALMNALAERTDAFAVGGTSMACTRGIWIYTKPQKGPNGDIYLIDTEGTASLDASQNHDVNINMMALMISSLMIVNSVGTIDQLTLNSMSLVTEIAKRLAASCSSSSGSSLEKEGLPEITLDLHLPDLMWCIRDHSVELCDENSRRLTADEYLDWALRPSEPKRLDKKKRKRKGEEEEQQVLSPSSSSSSSSSSGSLSALDETKSTLCKFPRRTCMTFVHPCSDEKLLANISKADPSQLRPEFVRQLGEFVDKVKTFVRPKTYCGKVISGTALIQLCDGWVESINLKRGLPTVESHWKTLSKLSCVEGENAAKAEFSAIITAVKAETLTTFASVYSKLMQWCIHGAEQKLVQTAYGSADTIHEFKLRLQEELKIKTREFELKHSQRLDSLLDQAVEKVIQMEIAPTDSHETWIQTLFDGTSNQWEMISSQCIKALDTLPRDFNFNHVTTCQVTKLEWLEKTQKALSSWLRLAFKAGSDVLKGEIAQLTSQKTELESLLACATAEVDGLKQSEAKLQLKLSGLENEIQQSRSHLAILEQDNVSLDQKIKSVATIQQEHEKLKEQNKQLELRNAAISQEKEDRAQQFSNHCKKLDQKIEAIVNLSFSLQKEVKQKDTLLEDANKQLVSVKAELEKEKESSAKTREQARLKKEQTDSQLREMNEKLINEIKTRHEEVSNFQRRCKTLEHSYGLIETERSTLKEMLTDSNEKLQKLQLALVEEQKKFREFDMIKLNLDYAKGEVMSQRTAIQEKDKEIINLKNLLQKVETDLQAEKILARLQSQQRGGLLLNQDWIDQDKLHDNH